MRGYHHIILDLCRELLKTVVCMKDGVKQLTLCRVFFSRYFIKDKSSLSLLLFFIFFLFTTMYMLNLKILCDVYVKKKFHYFDKLTFIIQTSQMSHCAFQKKRIDIG